MNCSPLLWLMVMWLRIHHSKVWHFILPQCQFWWCVAWFPSPFKNSRGIFNVILAVYAPWDAPHYMPSHFLRIFTSHLVGLKILVLEVDITMKALPWGRMLLGYVWYRSCQQKSLWGSRSKHKNLCISRESGDDVFAFYMVTKRHQEAFSTWQTA